MPVPAGYEPLPGSERPHHPESNRAEPIGRSEPVAVTILLNPRPDAPDEPRLEDWDDAEPGTRRRVSADEWMQTYGAEEGAVDRVAEFLESKGLRVLERSAGRRRIVAEGPAQKVN